MEGKKRLDDRPIVLVVEDDDLLRASLDALFRSANLLTKLFSSATEVLTRPLPDAVSCLVTDVRLPGATGFELHAVLRARGDEIPIIFMTSYGDVPMSVRAMKAGAVDFLSKPFLDQDVLDAVFSALNRDRARRSDLSHARSLSSRYASLTKREREVLQLVVDGSLNKQIAFRLGISEVTVKLHRSNVMRKMEARTLPQLTRVFEEIRRFKLVAVSAPGPGAS